MSPTVIAPRSTFFLAVLLTIATGIILSLAIGNVSAVSPNAQNDSLQWKEFSSSEGHFSILLPGTPVSKNSDRQTSAGKLKFHEFALALANASYSVGYLDYADLSDDAELTRSRFDAIRDEMLARNKASQLLNERELKEGAFTGREFLVLQDKKLFTILRTYLVHKRLYELAIQVPPATAFTTGKATGWQDQSESFKWTVSKFFNSFEVPEITETMDQFDRDVRELERKSPGILTVICKTCAGDHAPQDLKETGGFLNGSAINLVTPPYPSIARSAHAQGQVRVQVIIDSEGNVAAARAVDGHPLLRAAAEKAARESKFTPTTLEGKPVKVNGIIIYNFVAQ
jgi:TonB family protein